MSVLVTSLNSNPRIPYALNRPESPNAPRPSPLPTPDGTGSALHFSALDFGRERFSGYRYWLGFTPYFRGNDDIEDPAIVASQDGYHWEVPEGLTNPIYPRPPGERAYNSDIDIEYDPIEGLLHMWWRPVDWSIQNAPIVRVMHSSSSDAVNWSEPTEALRFEGDTNNASHLLSPSIVRVNSREWFMWYRDSSSVLQRCSASTAQGPWSEPEPCSFPGGGGAIWHLDVMQGNDGNYYAMLASSGRLFAASSRDGLIWSANQTPILSGRSGRWDESLYRGSLTEHENGRDFRIWYSGRGLWPDHPSREWRLGYTHIPRTQWPEPILAPEA